MAFFSTICAQQNPAENLVGTWQFDDTNSFATMDTISKVKLDSLPELKAQILSSYSGRSFSFYPDGNCSLKMANGQSFPYDWALTEDSVLVLTDPEGNSGQEMIRVLTNNRLVLVPKVEGKTRNIIEEQHFIKQQ
ncbi:MAG: lipocalin family protein [Bacteroidota bacterium]